MRHWGRGKHEMGLASIEETVRARDVDGGRYMLDGTQLIEELLY